MAIVAGFTYQDSGSLNVSFWTSQIPVATVPRVGGWAIALDGGAYVYDATAALPSGVTRIDGKAFTSDGALCITTDAPAATAIKIGGIAVRVDGAVHMDSSGVAVARVAGLGITATGAFISNAVHSQSDLLLEDGSFLLQEDGVSTFLLE